MTNPETGYEKAHRQVEQIFRQFFPARGMVTREGQIRLCHMMLDALFGLDVALCDAGVGLGKTYAYLVACVLWQLQRPRQMQRPVVISTASVALQSAILTEYIPFLSNILIQNGYIQKPICAVLRKGKERFACDRRLLIRQKQIGIRGERFRRRAAALRAANQCLDLDLLPGISRHDRRLICVPERCSRSCILHSDCRYRQYALRHTFATRALERGMDYKTLSAILGHYSVSFTMDTYVHSMDEHKRNEMDKMDDLFGISLEISVEQQPYPVLFTVTEEGCKAFAPDFPKIQIQAGTMETALMEAKKQIQKALSQFKYPPIPTRQEDIVVLENSVLILLKTA